MSKFIFSFLLVAGFVALELAPITTESLPLPQSDKGRLVIFASNGQIVGVQYYFATPYAKAPRCFVYGDHAVINSVDKAYIQILTPVGAKVEFLCEERK